jgi:hypothetical protein
MHAARIKGGGAVEGAHHVGRGGGGGEGGGRGGAEGGGGFVSESTELSTESFFAKSREELDSTTTTSMPDNSPRNSTARCPHTLKYLASAYYYTCIASSDYYICIASSYETQYPQAELERQSVHEALSY